MLVLAEIFSSQKLHNKKHEIAVDFMIVSGPLVFIFFGYGVKIEFNR